MSHSVITARQQAPGLPGSIFTDGPKKQCAANGLEVSGIPRDVIAFALSDDEQVGWAAGANRNLWLLLTQGELAFSCDDDIVWRTYGTPIGPHVALSSKQPLSITHCESIEHARTLVRANEIDLLAAHECLLGRTIAECLSEGPWLDPNLPVSEPLRRAALDNTGRVITTQTGLIGDCGFSSPTNLLLNPRGVRELPPSLYERALTNRNVIMLAPRASITDNRNFMSYAFGLDNRALMPPFLPACRNEDNVFRSLLHRMSESYVSGYIPYAVEHIPHQPRLWTRTASEEDMATQPAMADLIGLLINTCPKEPGNPETQLTRVGAHLEATGSLPVAEYERVLRPLLVRRAEAAIARFEKLLREHDRQPTYWAADCDRCIAAAHQNMNRPDLTTAREFRSAADPCAATAKSQRFVRRFGRLLVHWPAMRAAAWPYVERTRDSHTASQNTELQN